MKKFHNENAQNGDNENDPNIKKESNIEDDDGDDVSKIENSDIPEIDMTLKKYTGIKSPGPKIRNCELCGKTGFTREGLRIHMKTGII